MSDRPILLYNATVADSILLSNGRVLAVGSYADLASRGGVDAHKRDLRGSAVLPGLVDTHPHLLHFARRRAPLVDIADARSHSEIIDRIAARAKVTAERCWTHLRHQARAPIRVSLVC